MASVEECREVLAEFGARLGTATGAAQSAAQLDRTVSCHLRDLGVTFHGRLHDGRLDGLTTAPAPRAAIRLTTTSDDLVALVRGGLPFAGAWARGRVKVEASLRDLIRLRSLL